MQQEPALQRQFETINPIISFRFGHHKWCPYRPLFRNIQR